MHQLYEVRRCLALVFSKDDCVLTQTSVCSVQHAASYELPSSICKRNKKPDEQAGRHTE